MKEKFGIIFIVAIALLCLFGCDKDSSLEEKDMVFDKKLCPATIQSENLTGIIGWHI